MLRKQFVVCVETIIGFDSAWTDKVDGAIFWVQCENDHILKSSRPQMVNFAQAGEIIIDLNASSDYTLIALDQPTVVPNLSGSRPVDRLAASVVSKLKGGVQPANQSKVSMFGPNAPIWTFLSKINATEHPFEARYAQSGVFLIEAFPALALPSLIPEIWERKRAAKYNPANKSFLINDWQLVLDGLLVQASQQRIPAVSSYLAEMLELDRPKKADQDKLDAMICLMIAWFWRYGQPSGSAVLGDQHQGYVVSPCSEQVRAVLAASAVKRAIPFDTVWSSAADRERTVEGIS